MPPSESAMGLLYTTWPDEASALSVAETLLGEKLIACANILGASQSVYVWQGKLQRDQEVVALFKTTASLAPVVRDRLTKLHPYDEPCVLALDVQTGASAQGFLQWLADSVQ